MSCHISCNPSSPALKTLTLFLNPRSLLLWQPHRRPSKPDTPPITPYPSSPWLFVMAWLGLFRGKLTMSGISGVMKKIKLGVAAQKEVQLACSLILKPLKNIHSRQCLDTAYFTTCCSPVYGLWSREWVHVYMCSKKCAMKTKLVRFWGTPSNWAIFTYSVTKFVMESTYLLYKIVVSKWLNKRETFWTENNGHNHWGTARGISKSYWTMRTCRCVDNCYFHTRRKGASGLAKHDNMHVFVSFGTNSLCVCVYPCWSSIPVA